MLLGRRSLSFLSGDKGTNYFNSETIVFYFILKPTCTKKALRSQYLRALKFFILDYFVSLKISFPNTNIIKAIMMKNPTICAFSKNLSLNGFPWIISINKKITWPPSNAGIGRIFINANAIESIPTKLQNLNQSTSVPNMVAIPTGPESALSARTSPLKIFPKPLMLSVITEKALLAPNGNDSIKPYLCCTTGRFKKPKVEELSAAAFKAIGLPLRTISKLTSLFLFAANSDLN